MISESQICCNTATFCVAAIFVKYCYTTDGCYNSWANLRCSGCSPLGEKLLWKRTISLSSIMVFTSLTFFLMCGGSCDIVFILSTPWSWIKAATILDATFSNAFSCMKTVILLFILHWDMLPMVQLTICQHWFRLWLGTEQAASHYLNQWWFSLLMHIYIAGPLWVNTLRPKQNGPHFADDIFKCIFLNENAWILIKISLKFVPKGSINNIPALVQIMAWRRPGVKPLSEPSMVSLLTHICVIRPQWVNEDLQTPSY